MTQKAWGETSLKVHTKSRIVLPQLIDGVELLRGSFPEHCSSVGRQAPDFLMYDKASNCPDPLAEEGSDIATLVDLLRWRSGREPDRPAYTFLVDGETEEIRLTYQELDAQARAIAATLQGLAARGERALLLYPPGLEFIAALFGCLYAGVVAIPAYPPDPNRINRSLPRLLAIIADSQPVVVLTTAPLLAMAKLLFERAPALKKLKWLATETIASGVGQDLQETPLTDDTLAFLQYTSGSTGAPKGVMLAHSNLLHNARLVYHAFEHTPGDRYVSWLPTFHDMGFMAGVLQPLYAGLPVVLMSPISFLQNPVRWLRAITRYRATTSGGPNFAYDLCVRKIKAQDRASLELSSWSVAFNGAEPVRRDTLERFTKTFEPCGFRMNALYPCYGLAEATLIVSGGRKSSPPVVKTFRAAALEKNRVVEAHADDADARALVGCGQTLPGQTIICVNTESLTQCSPEEVGEIWVSGPSVAKGYWGCLEETEQRFRAHVSPTGAGPFLRTGDLGLLRDGELFIAGRLKDLIIIRGLNHYPQDIEVTVEKCHPALRPGCGAAFSVEVAGEERLAIVQEVDPGSQADAEALIDAIRQAVADDHELQAHAVVLIKPGTIPKTSSGKIQRHACRAGFLEGGLEEVARSILESPPAARREDSFIRKALLAVDTEKRTALLEAYVQEQVAKVLKVAPQRIHAQRPLTAVGLDSLMAIELKNQLETELGVEVPVTDFLRGCSVADFASQLAEQMQEPARHESPSAPTPGQQSSDLYPLSYGQQALWFLHQLAPESAAYNVAFAASIDSAVDVPALRRAFQGLLDRHASLRAVFLVRDGQPVQRVLERATVDFAQVDAANLAQDEFEERLIERAHVPFDLERAPLLRATLFTRSARESVLLLVVHHIVFDGWSLWVLLDELASLYSAEKKGEGAALPPLPLQYTDYVRRQAEVLAGPEGERLWAYWQKELSGELPVLDLPTSRARPPVQTFRGASHAIELDQDLVRRLKQVASSEGATLYMLLVATFQILLHRYTRQQDIVVGSPVSARSRAEFGTLVGCFFNVVVLRADLSGNPTFASFLGQVRGKVLKSLDHQDYPSHLLAERLHLTREASRPPLFQVTFILQKPYRLQEASLASGDAGCVIEAGELALKPYPVRRRSARAELELELIELGQSVSGWLHYNTDLFDAEVIARMALHFQTLLEGVAANPQQRVADLPILTDAERRQLLADWSRTGRDYSRPVCVHDLFDEQVRRTPGKAASVEDSGHVIYQTLHERADKLARLIKRIQE